MNAPRNITTFVIPHVVTFITVFVAMASLPNRLDAQLMQWPVESPDLTQAYARYGAVVDTSYHTGVDIVNSSVDNYSYSSVVKASAPGTIVKIFGINIEGNNLRSWNHQTDSYSWEAAPTSDSNHGLGISIILYHSDLQLYTLYGHLDAVVSNLAIDQQVDSGQVIGRMGNSHQAFLRRCPVDRVCPVPLDAPDGTVVSDSSGFGPHLHFEVKDRGVLSAGRSDDCDLVAGCYWGYTPGPPPSTPGMPGHPNWFGYHDPNAFLNATVERFPEPLSIQLLRFPLEVRDYPDFDEDLSLVITTIEQRSGIRPSLVAARGVGSEWYQVYLPNSESEGWSASGWIPGIVDGVIYARPDGQLPQTIITTESARIFDQPNNDASTLAFAYGENELDPQRFVPFQRIPFNDTIEWYRVGLPKKASSVSGWLSAGAVGYVGRPLVIGDLNNDCLVDVIDLGTLLSYWGNAAGLPADINYDGIVDVQDLGIILSNWSATAC